MPFQNKAMFQARLIFYKYLQITRNETSGIMIKAVQTFESGIGILNPRRQKKKTWAFYSSAVSWLKEAEQFDINI